MSRENDRTAKILSPINKNSLEISSGKASTISRSGSFVTVRSPKNETDSSRAALTLRDHGVGVYSGPQFGSVRQRPHVPPRPKVFPSSSTSTPLLNNNLSTTPPTPTLVPTISKSSTLTTPILTPTSLSSTNAPILTPTTSSQPLLTPSGTLPRTYPSHFNNPNRPPSLDTPLSGDEMKKFLQSHLNTPNNSTNQNSSTNSLPLNQPKILHSRTLTSTLPSSPPSNSNILPLSNSSSTISNSSSPPSSLPTSSTQVPFGASASPSPSTSKKGPELSKATSTPSFSSGTNSIPKSPSIFNVGNLGLNNSNPSPQKPQGGTESVFSQCLRVGLQLAQATSQIMDDQSDIDNLKDESFKAKVRIWVSAGQNNGNEFKVIDHASIPFRRVREVFGITDQDYLSSLSTSAFQDQKSKGKSGALFFFSSDKKYVVKTLTIDEKRFLSTILKTYLFYCRDHPTTLLPKFYGLYTLATTERKAYLVVMANVFGTNLNIDETYDLKGSTIGRITTVEQDKIDPTVVLKDLNLMHMHKRLNLHRQLKIYLITQLSSDCQFLEDHEIMDYSFLLGIHHCPRSENGSNTQGNKLPVLYSVKSAKDQKVARENLSRSPTISTFTKDSFDSYSGIRSSSSMNGSDEIYFMGIIDILQKYTVRKKLETSIMSAKYEKKEISSVNPNFYSKRFQSFIATLLE